MTRSIDRSRLADLMVRETKAFEAEHPRSRELFDRAATHLLGGVPMTWMLRWAGGFPLFLDRASGAGLTDVDGHTYVDLALGDTGAMTGHSPEGSIGQIQRQVQNGITTMLPTEDAIWVGDELARRFGMDSWQFTLSATDANRFAIRIAREITQRPKILVHEYCYHGSVDETFALLGDDGRAVTRPGNVGPPVPLDVTTVVVPFNDLDALERALAVGDVAVCLFEPALTNQGIVLPDPGYHDGVRELTRTHGSLLLIDETHCFSAGPRGATGAWGLEPDIVTIGKAIGSGVPAGALGITTELRERMLTRTDADYYDVGGIGGTLAGNALSLAAVRATLENVLTEEAFARMIELASMYTDNVRGVISAHDLPWTILQLGARAEYMFMPDPPRDGADVARYDDEELDAFTHLYQLNRGILLTPFHNMALMSPATTAGDVEAHHKVFDEMAGELVA